MASLPSQCENPPNTVSCFHGAVPQRKQFPGKVWIPSGVHYISNSTPGEQKAVKLCSGALAV